MSFIDLIAPSILGVTFTFLGSFKCYGLMYKIEGGVDKSLLQQLCGV